MFPIFQALRPHHWMKNGIVFIALIFADKLYDVSSIIKSIIACMIFCFASSGVYLWNDIKDKQADQRHPLKKLRPIASGKVSSALANVLALLCIGGSITIAWFYGIKFFSVIIIYIILNILYSLKLKRVQFIDILCIAFGFVLRAVSGGIIIDVVISSWLLVCTFLLTLYIAITKRRQEIVLMGDNNNNSTRTTLEHYSLHLLDQMSMPVLTCSLMAYILYTFNSVHSQYLLITIPVVFYGIFRYLYLVQKKQLGEDPIKLFISDHPIKITVLIWILLNIGILYFIPK